MRRMIIKTDPSKYVGTVWVILHINSKTVVPEEPR